MPDIGKKTTDDLSTTVGYTEPGAQEASESRDMFLDADAARSEWFNDRLENDRFYHNNQYSDDEIHALESAGQAPLVMNITYSIGKQIVSILTGSSPMWEVDPVNDASKNVAYLHRSLLYGIWEDSLGDRQLEQIIKNMVVTGVGYGEVALTNNSTFGMKFRRIPYQNVWISPNATEIDYSDADYIIVSKVISTRNAAKILNMDLEEVEEWARNDITLPNSEQSVTRYSKYVGGISRDGKHIRIIYRYQIEKATCYIVEPNRKDVDIGARIYFHIDDTLEKLRKDGIINIKKINRYVLAKYTSIGDYCEKYYLPIDRYNIVPFIDEFTDSPYPLGCVDFLYGLQRTLNKLVINLLLNAALANNMRAKAPKGSVDKAEYESSFGKTGVLIEYEESEGGHGLELLQPVQLSGEFYRMPEMVISIMEYVSGIFGVMQGNPEGAPRTAAGTMSLQSYGGQKVKMLMRNTNTSLALLGDIAVMMNQNFSGFNQEISFYDKYQKKNVDLAYNVLTVEGDRIKIQNDLSKGKFKTRVNIIQGFGTERQAKANVLSNLMAQTRSPLLLKPILRLLDVEETDEILKEMDVLENAKGNIAQLQSSIKRLNQINTQLENALLQKSRTVEVEKFKSELSDIKAKVENYYKSVMGESAQQTMQNMQGTEGESPLQTI
jgi:hypothetical protein